MDPNQGIDIIIPVYNALEDLKICIDSIKAHTDLSGHRLIIINDASPDPQVIPYLDSQSDDHILVLHQQNNLGFSASVNKGLRQSDRDVLLLNSDTIVTKGWLEKILACAGSDETIGTVTPLSNNATLCSVPDFCQENQIPEGYSLEPYAELIESVSLKRYPPIPVAHGFCMFIKRKVIRRIGLFDTDAFESGYGEEVDFCFRAEQFGFRHVLCDDVFIYHRGTSSFVSKEKGKYCQAHERILEKRYPVQMRGLKAFCCSNPNWEIAENIKLNTALRNGRKNILYLVQTDFREDAHDHIGGIQLHVKDLCEGLKHQVNVYVAARNRNDLNLTCYIGEKEYCFRFPVGEAPEFPVIRDKRFARLYEEILLYFQIDLVHIHHTLGLSQELFYQAKEKGIPLLATLHDYYFVCPTVKLLNAENQYCREIADNEMCRRCLSQRQGINCGAEYLKFWREENQKALALADQIFAPSQSTKEVICFYYPRLKEKITVIGHGSLPLMNGAAWPKAGKKEPAASFHVAFLGGIGEAKGSRCASQLVKNSPSDIRWHLFGLYGYNDLSVVERANFVKTGEYSREELPGLLKQYQIDLVCILSICPETFCYTLSEAVLCGIPVIAKDIGAVGERVRELQCGWLVPCQASYREILEIIEQIKDRGPAYQEKTEAIQKVKIPDIEEMCRKYTEAYQRQYRQRQRPKAIPDINRRFLENYLFCSSIGSTENGALLKQLKETERQLWEATNSTAYRAAQILGQIRIPFRKQLKGILYGIYQRIK